MDPKNRSWQDSSRFFLRNLFNNTHLIHIHLSGPYQLICLSTIRNIAHFINLFDLLTSLNKNYVLISHQLYFCSSNTLRNEMSKRCSITLTELPKKMGHPVLTGIFPVAPALMNCVIFTWWHRKVDVFVITINIYHLKTNPNYNHKSKNLTIIMQLQ